MSVVRCVVALAGFVLAGVVSSGTASAADMPLKAPALQVSDRWSGWYLGVNGGYGDPSGIDIGASNSGTGAGALATNARASNTLAIPGNLKTDPRGGVGGGQIGYNWRLGPQWLIGLETDFDYANIQGSDLRMGASTNGTTLFNTFASTATVAGSQNTNWLGTFRGRVGALLSDNFLLYATGGLAYAHISASTALSETGCNAFAGCTTVAGGGAASSTRAGWTVGGGAEWSLNRNWSVKAEYLYVHLGNLTYANSALVFPAFSVVNTTSTAHFNTNLGRLGVNYKF